MIDTDTGIMTYGSFTLCESNYADLSPIILDLPELIENMKLSESYISGGLNFMILKRDTDSKMVITAVQKEIEIISFQSGNSLSIELLEGRIKFKTKEESILLDRGQLLTVCKSVDYEIKALEETVFLLTIDNQAPSARL
jgi:hypothetical protein